METVDESASGSVNPFLGSSGAIDDQRWFLMPSSKRSRKAGAIQRKFKIRAAKQRGEVDLKGIDAAVVKLRERAQAGEHLTDAQQALLDDHGGVWPPSYD